jgi:hypothetical protein
LKLGKAIEILKGLFVHLLRGLDNFFIIPFFNLYSARMLWKCEKRSGIIFLNDEWTVSVTELVTRPTENSYQDLSAGKSQKYLSLAVEYQISCQVFISSSQMNPVRVFAVYIFIISFEVVLLSLYRTPKSFNP